MDSSTDHLERVDRGFGRWGGFVYKHRWLVLVITALVIALSVFFASSAQIDNGLDSYFDPSDEAYENYLDYQSDFGSDEVAYLLYMAPDLPHGPFNLDVMRTIDALTRALEDEVPFVKDVTSLTNVEFIQAEGDDLEIIELGLDFPETQEELLARRDAMMKKPMYIGSFIDRDAAHGAIILEMSLSSSDPLDELRLDPEGGDGLENLYPQASNNVIKEILARPQFADAGITFYRSGDVNMNSAYNEVINDDAAMLTLLTLAMVLVLSLIFFRRHLIGIVGPLAVVLLGLLFTVGFIGVMGYKIGLLFLIVPTLITAIGVAQAVHLVADFRSQRSQGLDRQDAIRNTLDHVGMPCFLAAITTAAGFGAMSTSKIASLGDLSIYLSAGVMLTFLLSVTVMVVLMSFGKEAVHTETERKPNGFIDDMMQSIFNFNLRHPLVVLAVSAALFVAAFVGISKLTVGFNFLNEFKKGSDFYKETSYIENVMGGILSVVYVVDSGKEDGVKDVELLRQLEAVQEKANTIPLVKKTYSVVDILKDINQSFHGDDPAYHVLPDDSDLIAQYLLLYEFSGGGELEDYISGDYARTVLELRVEMTDSPKIEALVNELDRLIATQPRGDDFHTTGIGLLWMKMGEYIGDSQITGYLFAFVAIAVILCIAFSSVKVGLICMIPNLTPVVLMLGTLGWLGIQLDYFLLLLATIAIGIAVDDTVHLTTRFRKEFLRTGNYDQAMLNALRGVGPALTITSVVLCIAFSSFLLSQMAVLTKFGLLLSLAILAALIADLFLMPVLLRFFKPFGPETQSFDDGKDPKDFNDSEDIGSLAPANN